MAGEHGEPAEMASAPLPAAMDLTGSFRPPADRFGDVAHRHAFFRDRVIFRARLGPFERQPVEAGDIRDMRRRPAVAAVADIGADALSRERPRSTG